MSIRGLSRKSRLPLGSAMVASCTAEFSAIPTAFFQHGGYRTTGRRRLCLGRNAMAADSSSAGDPRRSLELLWGLAPARRRGPRPRLSVEEIAIAAIELADAEGLSALSMRRVADRLKVATMSLYTYVPSKAELIDVMLDRVYGETPKTYGAGAGWRARLGQGARGKRDLYHRHPWMLQVVMHRPVLGPNMIAKFDFELRAIEGEGLTDLEMDQVIS